MKCPKCGHVITKRRKRCEVCGQDISMYERLCRISNSFYNRGLERARVRDLSGAVTMLKKSLEINKENTEARNLLGLVYFEMGEVVAALGEWVISKHFHPEDDEADSLIEKVQSDTVAFDQLNQSIKKYNIALANAKRQDDDLAILQLKRVISMNPKYIRALLLLALVYLKNCEYEKARRCLVRVQKVDVGNVDALRYMEEIRLHTQPGTQGADLSKEEDYNGAPQIAPISSYREDKPNFIAFLTFFLGIVIGVAVIYYMAVPNIRQSIVEEYNQKERDYSALLSSKDITISSLESNARILENTIADLESEIRNAENYVPVDYEPFIELFRRYYQYINTEEPLETETVKLINDIYAMDISEFPKEGAGRALYASMKADMDGRVAAMYFAEAMETYATNPAVSLKPLEQAYGYHPNDVEIMYHLARVYHTLGQLEQAKVLYEGILADYAESTRAQEAEVYLGYLTEQLLKLTVTPTP